MTEDLLRRSLEAEAEDVVAGPDLEARVRAAVTGAATRRRRRAPRRRAGRLRRPPTGRRG